ncbi:hypothetical protein Bbelb_239560 [Branchiostoma belcheri]|nr:hypothetical protein Bbelb_239560 [Branchiostoma belcheri]
MAELNPFDYTQRIEAFEIKCYRKLLSVSWTEHRTNTSVLEELGIGRSLLHIIRRRKLQYFEHVSRAQNISTHVHILLASCAGPAVMAKDREGWRKLVLHTTTVPDPPDEDGTR